MGMYTELVFACELKKDTPKEVIDILEYMVGNPRKDPIIPAHELFSTSRWEWMFKSNSYYFDGDTHSTLRFDDMSKAYVLTVRCNLKNYDNEIEKFIDWIKPYVDKIDDYLEFKGYYRYEENDKPTLIYI